MPRYILVVSFVLSCIFLRIGWIGFAMLDQGMWASQASFMQTGDARQFDLGMAYGHPGGPVIIGTTLIHKVFGYSYLDSLNTFLIVFCGLIIAITCTICYLLKKDLYWILIVLVILSLSRLYDSLTPPSGVAALLFVLLSIVTLYIYTKKDTKNNLLLFSWAVVAGLATATRVDMGTIGLFVFVLLLKQILSWKQISAMILVAFVTFCVSDPYMWYMPIQHIGDLLYKITYHYADYTPIHMSFSTVIISSCFAFVSIFLALALSFLKKEIEHPLPLRYLYTVLVMTVYLYAVFLTAHYQAIRYFVPLIFIWEVFLPIYIFSIIDHLEFNFLKSARANVIGQRIIKIIMTCMFVVYPIVLIAYSLTVSH